jgi:uncharacterized membrane protein YozB (DUF420 family)
MYNALLHAHSGLRWVALILLVTAIFNAVKGKSSGEYLKKDKMINLFAMILLHTQLLIGLILYFNKESKVRFTPDWMKDAMLRFYGMEHFLMMVIAIVLVTIGRKKAEKADAPIVKHQKIVVWYAIALIVILAAIPWPFRAALGGQWF